MIPAILKLQDVHFIDALARKYGKHLVLFSKELVVYPKQT
jgi:hypothetical protein